MTLRRCGRATEIYSRVTGYFRPLSNWNRGKQEEFRQRRFFRLEVSRKAEVAAAENDTRSC